MNDQLSLDLEGDRDAVLEKVATLLQGVADDRQHVRIDAEITLEPEAPPVGEPDLDPDETADADLSSFVVEQPDDSQDRLANAEPETVPDDAERDDDGEAVLLDDDDTADTSDTANTSSGSTTERELNEPEPGCLYHEVLAHLLRIGATTPDSAVTSADLEVPEGRSSSPELTALYRKQMIDRDESTRPYKWWINGYGIAYLNANASALEAFDHDHEINQQVGTVATDGGDDA